MAAYEGHWHLWLSSRTAARRNVTDLALVCAYGKDLWTINDGGRKGVKVGARVPDLDRIQKLSCGVLTEGLVESYFVARQSEAGLTGGQMVNIEAVQNAAWNKTLGHACDVFGEDARRHAFKGLSLPDVSGFVKAPRLPEVEALPEPFSAVEFAELCGTFDALRVSQPDLWLLNLITRQTGMRPRYVMGLRGSWLVEGDGGRWFIELKSRPEEGFGKKKGRKSATLNQLIPVTDMVRAEIQRRGPGLTVGAALGKSARADLGREHNALIKRVVKDEGSHGQGAYRYRDTVACVLGFLLGLEAAQRALGHKTALTTLQHYTRDLPRVSDLMRAELAAWLELPSMRR
jgi:integrase